MANCEVPAGKFGYCVLQEQREKVEAECFACAVEGEWTVILVPQSPSATQSESSWQVERASGSGPREGPELRVDDALVVSVLKVDTGAVRRVAQTRSVSRRFGDPRPSSATLFKAFYSSEWGASDAQAEMGLSSTEEGVRDRQSLELENRRLQLEVRRLSQGSRGEAATPQEKNPLLQSHIGTDEEGAAEDGCESFDSLGEDAPGEADMLVKRLAKFSFAEAAAARRREAEEPSRTQKLRERAAAVGQAAEREAERPMRRLEKDGALASGDQQSERATRSGRRAPARVPDREEVMLQMQLEMMRLMKEMREHRPGVDGDAPDGNELDGLRVVRNLSRMRVMKEQVQNNPKKTVREFREVWVERLGASGRAFKWQDRNEKIKWGKYASVKRFDWMLSHIMESMDRGDFEFAHAQVAQCMKVCHDFAGHGSWRAAWPYSHMVDPMAKHHHGATEAETEAVMGWLRTQDDLKAKVLKSTREQVSDEEEKPEGQEGDANKKKKKHR